MILNVPVSMSTDLNSQLIQATLQKVFMDDMHCLPFCEIAAGNVINILLINDVLLHPSASHLLLIGIIFMTRWTTVCSFTHTVTRSSLSPPRKGILVIFAL